MRYMFNNVDWVIHYAQTNFQLGVGIAQRNVYAFGQKPRGEGELVLSNKISTLKFFQIYRLNQILILSNTIIDEIKR